MEITEEKAKALAVEINTFVRDLDTYGYDDMVSDPEEDIDGLKNSLMSDTDTVRDYLVSIMEGNLEEGDISSLKVANDARKLLFKIGHYDLRGLRLGSDLMTEGISLNIESLEIDNTPDIKGIINSLIETKMEMNFFSDEEGHLKDYTSSDVPELVSSIAFADILLGDLEQISLSAEDFIPTLNFYIDNVGRDNLSDNVKEAVNLFLGHMVVNGVLVLKLRALKERLSAEFFKKARDKV